jgi:hypothetical protein
MVRVGHQQHSHHTPVDKIHGQHLDIQAQSPHGKRRRAARPHGVSRHGQRVRPIGPHTIDRFASALNMLLPRYNANWLDSSSETVIALHLSDANWRDENNWCNPPWHVLPALAQKLLQSGATFTMVAPRWQGKAWHQALPELACNETVMSARAHWFRPGRRPGRGTIGKPQ